MTRIRKCQATAKYGCLEIDVITATLFYAASCSPMATGSAGRLMAPLLT